MFRSDSLQAAIRRKASCAVLTQTYRFVSLQREHSGLQRHVGLSTATCTCTRLHDYLITLSIYITKCTPTLQWVCHPLIYPAVPFKFQHKRYDTIQNVAFMQTRQPYTIQLTEKRMCLCTRLLHRVILPIGYNHYV